MHKIQIFAFAERDEHTNKRGKKRKKYFSVSIFYTCRRAGRGSRSEGIACYGPPRRHENEYHEHFLNRKKKEKQRETERKKEWK